MLLFPDCSSMIRGAHRIITNAPRPVISAPRLVASSATYFQVCHNPPHGTSVVLATVPNSWVGSGSGSDPEPNRCNRSYHTKTWTVAIGPVLPPKTRHFNRSWLAPIKNLRSDHIMTWSTCKLWSFLRSFTFHFQMCDWTINRCVSFENPRILRINGRCFTAILWILVGFQVWTREVKERIKLQNLRVDHVTIRSELKYLIGAKGVGTV
jgi:hypothetical protein